MKHVLSAAGGPHRFIRALLFSLALAPFGPLLARGQAPTVTGLSPARNLRNAVQGSSAVGR